MELFLFMGKIKSVLFLRESIRKKYASCTFLKGKCTDTFRDRQRKTTKAIEQKVDRSRQAILLYRGGECICCYYCCLDFDLEQLKQCPLSRICCGIFNIFLSIDFRQYCNWLFHVIWLLLLFMYANFVHYLCFSKEKGWNYFQCCYYLLIIPRSSLDNPPFISQMI